MMTTFVHRCVSAMIFSAALRPGAPMMPPPGCVAEPHMYRPSTGVRYCAHPGTGRRKNSCSSASSPWKMFPSVSPNSRSRSSGVMTWRCRMMLFRCSARTPRACRRPRRRTPRAASSHVPSVEVIRRVLHEAGHHVLARRRHRRVGERRDDDVDVRPAREPAVLRRRRTHAPCSRRSEKSRSRRAGARPAPGRQVKSGSPSSARLTLPDEPRNL